MTSSACARIRDHPHPPKPPSPGRGRELLCVSPLCRAKGGGGRGLGVQSLRYLEKLGTRPRNCDLPLTTNAGAQPVTLEGLVGGSPGNQGWRRERGHFGKGTLDLVCASSGMISVSFCAGWCCAVLSRSFVSDSWRPHGIPWNSPGQDTGVGCHFLLQGDLPHPGIEPRSPAWRADSFTS